MQETNRKYSPEYRRGAKSGLLAGLIHGLIVGIPLYAIWQTGSFYDFIANGARSSLPGYSPSEVSSIISLSILMIPIALAVGGIIGGTILGLMYAGIRNLDLKKQVAPVPSWLLGVVFFVVELAIIALSSQFHFGVTYGESIIVISAIASLAFGYLLGNFFTRFGRSRSPPTERRSPNAEINRKEVREVLNTS